MPSLAEIRRWLPDSRDARLLEREGRLRCSKEGQMRLPSSENYLRF
jgi:hypothetical protein